MPETSVVRCFAKVRPSKPSEESNLKLSGEKVTGTINGSESSFSFDAVYKPEDKVRDIFKEKCEPLLHRVVEGTNVSIVAMGTTGSGKTMFMNGVAEDPGIAARMIRGLYEVIERMKNKEFFVTASFVEVLDDELIDLINPHEGHMKVRSTPQWNVYVDGLSEMVGKDAEQLIQYYEQGTRARKMGTHDARAHREKASAVFMIHVEQREPGRSGMGLRSSLSLVDLAGLESGACDQLVECIKSLRDKKTAADFRSSLLSKILQETFGGNCLTSVFCLLAPDAAQNLLTLSVSQSVRGIKHSVSINIDDTEQIIANLRDEISSLREKITKSSSPNRDDVMRLQDLVKDLQITKQQTWDQKQKLSMKYEEERKSNLANRGILEWVMDTKHRERQLVQERIVNFQSLKEKLVTEYKQKSAEDKDLEQQLQKHLHDFAKINESSQASDSERKTRFKAIQDLKDRKARAATEKKALKQRLQEVHQKLKIEQEDAVSKSFATKGSAELAWIVEHEERQKLEEQNKMILEEEREKLKANNEHDKAEIELRVESGNTYSARDYADLEIKLSELTNERAVTNVLIQSLKGEKTHLQNALSELYKQHKVEAEKQQMVNFQTFRNYREMFDKQKAALETRYRELLEESIQDAIFLSSRNSELVDENHKLRQEIAALKDRLSMSGGK